MEFLKLRYLLHIDSLDLWDSLINLGHFGFLFLQLFQSTNLATYIDVSYFKVMTLVRVNPLATRQNHVFCVQMT
jgi:hypothetical protein